MAAWKPDNKRFTELLLVLSERFADNPRFGAIKLNKLLFYCDFLSYAMLGRPLTGFEYQKRPHGPVPRGVLSIQSAMQQRGELLIEEIRLPSGKVQHRSRNLRKPRLDVFSREELDIIDQISRELSEHDAESISNLSHLEVGWKAASEYETIPYGTVYLSDQSLSQVAIENAQRFAREHGYSTQ